MRICIYGTEADRQMLMSAAAECQGLAFRQCEADYYDSYDALLRAMKDNRYDLTIIMKDNADGMEGVIAVKALSPAMPVIWFSNDKAFGAQSFRLNVAYFHEKPVTTQILGKALANCRLI